MNIDKSYFKLIPIEHSLSFPDSIEIIEYVLLQIIDMKCAGCHGSNQKSLFQRNY